MNPVYEALFDTYGCSVPREADNCGEAAITALPEQCAPDRKARLELGGRLLRPLPPVRRRLRSGCTLDYPCSTIRSAVSAPSRSSKARGDSSTWAPIFPAEI